MADGVILPDLGHTGGGVSAYVGSDALDGLFRFGSSLEVRQADVGFGYCIERCALSGSRPARAQQQLQILPTVEIELRALELGPLGFTVGLRTGVSLSTSTTGDPPALGLQNSLQLGVRAALPAHLSFEAHLRSDNGTHFVPNAPTTGYTGAYVVDAGFVYTFDVDER